MREQLQWEEKLVPAPVHGKAALATAGKQRTRGEEYALVQGNQEMSTQQKLCLPYPAASQGAWLPLQ